MNAQNRDLEAVFRFLAASVRRVRRLALLKGVALVGIVWLVSLAAVMAVDARLVIFDDRLRWAMSAGEWALVVVTALVTVVRPLCRRIGFRQMAAILDRRHPEHEERLSSIVELSDQLRDPTAAHGFSLSLYACLGELARKDVAKLDLRREFSFLSAGLFLLLFAALALAMGAGVASSPHLLGRLFIRAVAPWADVGNLYSNDIVVTPGDAVVLSGTVVDIRAAVDKSLHALPTIRISRRRGLGWTEEVPEAMSNGLYRTTADSAESEWRYRVNAGPAMTRYYRVRVSKRPSYDSFTATVTYPEYTGFGSVVFSNEQVSAIRAIEGSRVSFRLEVSEPGTVADFRIGRNPVFEHTMVSNRTDVWSLELVNNDGFRSALGRHALRSVPDQPPTLVIENPTSGATPLPSYAKIPIEFTASDDVQIRRPRLRCAVDGGEMYDLGDVDEFCRVGGRLWRGKTELDLSTLDLRKAKKVAFGLFAWDNCPAEFGGAHSATSAVVEVTLTQPGQPVPSNVQQFAKEAAALLDEAKKRLQAAERLADELKNEIAVANRRNEKVSERSERKTESAAHEIGEAKKRLDELAERFDDDARFEPLEDAAEAVVEEKVRPVLEKVAVSPFQERAERQATMESASGELREARSAVDKLARMVRARADSVGVFERAKNVAARQEKREGDLRRNESPDYFRKLFRRLGWFRIQGALEEGVSEQDFKDVPSEYQDLVRRYFLKLNEGK